MSSGSMPKASSAFVTAPRMQSRMDEMTSTGLCSHHPGWGVICLNSFWEKVTSLALESKMMAREEDVPWSRDITNGGVKSLLDMRGVGGGRGLGGCGCGCEEEPIKTIMSEVTVHLDGRKHGAPEMTLDEVVVTKDSLETGKGIDKDRFVPRSEFTIPMEERDEEIQNEHRMLVEAWEECHGEDGVCFGKLAELLPMYCNVDGLEKGNPVELKEFLRLVVDGVYYSD
eukprot:TRINITY_DN830_c0_g1_i9.p1 TRINITY_DN830_c0_g1~~TRINITY_DN830_c0_g1_i9.p1  ORF type:complete len:227 (-),score=18.12 TRINITY_DN830_c0_g1_i9:166-846(-)